MSISYIHFHFSSKCVISLFANCLGHMALVVINSFQGSRTVFLPHSCPVLEVKDKTSDQNS